MNTKPNKITETINRFQDLDPEILIELASFLKKRGNKTTKSMSRKPKRSRRKSTRGSNSLKSIQKKVKKNSLKTIVGEIKQKDFSKLSMLMHTFFSDCVTLDQITDDIGTTIGIFNHMIRERGISEGVKRYKIERQYVLRKLLGLPNQTVEVLKLDKDGWPNKYRFLKDRVQGLDFRNRRKSVKYINTILSISRLVKEPDMTIGSFPSITNPLNKSDQLIDEISEFKSDLPGLLKDLGIECDLDPAILRVKDSSCIKGMLSTHSSTNVGPNNTISINGKKYRGNATITSHIDALSVINDRELSKNIQRFATLTDNSKVIETMYTLASIPESKSWNPNPVHSRLGILSQPENKRRVVAIIDYWSQTLLKPLHNVLAKSAKKVPCSYYEDQDAGRELCRQFTTDPSAYPVSYDATDFTDRFPRLIQEAVLAVLFNEQFAKSAIKLMACRNFRTPNGKIIRYGAGQPMGAYGSFSLAHLTHALYAHWKISLFGEDPKSDVAVVGDDIAFRYKSEAMNQYIIGMELLGVPFNIYKGFESTEEHKIVEFCKRLYVNGKDQSAISPRVAKLATTDFKYLPTLDQYLNTGEYKVGELLNLPIFERYRSHLEKLYLLPSKITGIKNNLDFNDVEGLADSTIQFINKLKSIEDVAKVSLNEFLGTLYTKALIAYSNVMLINLLDVTGVLANDPTALKRMPSFGTRNKAKGKLSDEIVSKAKLSYAKELECLPDIHPIKVISQETSFNCSLNNMKVKMNKKLHDLPSIVDINFVDPLSSASTLRDISQNKSFLRKTIGDPRSVLSNEGKETWVQALFAISNAMIESIDSAEVTEGKVKTKMYILPKKNNIEVELEILSPIPDLNEKPKGTNSFIDFIRNHRDEDN